MTAGPLAIAAAGLATIVFWQATANIADRQLAMAYSQSRTMELRIPRAGYATLIPTSDPRGPAMDTEPAPLSEARARITRELERSPQSPHWLELKARAELLNRHYDAAIDIFDRLIDLGTVDPELLADAASAYFQRGLASDGQIDRSKALDLLSRADRLAPADPVILFNEAVVMQDRGQMMNAVEVWTRYITVERDARWAEEGKRKLTALEQTLNRLKSHESRIRQMLATPEAIDALAADAQRLAALDEELATMKLDLLLPLAFPEEAGDAARGSPCTPRCMAARRLLKALSSSLELHHHDPWLADLLPSEIVTPEVLPAAGPNRPGTARFGQALRLLVAASQENLNGVPEEGERLVAQARSLFLQLQSEPGLSPALRSAAMVGEQRALEENLFALQRGTKFSECRQLAASQGHRWQSGGEMARSPWMQASAMVTEKVCDDTPESRSAGRALAARALTQATASRYSLLKSRIELMDAVDAQNADDSETAERIILATLESLYAMDAPPLRIASSVSAFGLTELNSSRPHMLALCWQESLPWLEMTGDRWRAGFVRMDLAQAELRIGAMQAAQNQLRMGLEEAKSSESVKAKAGGLFESETLTAQALLETGDLEGATHYLEDAKGKMARNSDRWILRSYASSRGLVLLDQGRTREAAALLEPEIRASEGARTASGNQDAGGSESTERAQQDHDLYGELAATGLKQGRSPESVLALWERFRLRSRGAPIAPCLNGALDCDQAALKVAQSRLGSAKLIGQIVLLDRVLVYRVDARSVQWSEKPVHRQQLLDAAQRLAEAVSLPLTTTETAERMGADLSAEVLPDLSADVDGLLLLEPDPLLVKLPWSVLPMANGPLGLQYSLAESRSMLLETPSRAPIASTLSGGEDALVVGASVAEQGEPLLVEALTEARNVDRLLSTRGQSTDLLLGSQATSARVANALASATIFHFAGHALKSTEGTELLLAPLSAKDATPWIDSAFLRRHPPRACRLAVLSACSTGSKASGWNRPVNDIVETLGSLGVQEVVATRWQVDSAASVPFIDAFYGSLGQGDSTAKALTQARRELSTLDSYRNPYYWGAYYVTVTESAGAAAKSTAALAAVRGTRSRRIRHSA